MELLGTHTPISQLVVGSGGVSKGLGLGVALEVGFTSGARTVVVSADP